MTVRLVDLNFNLKRKQIPVGLRSETDEEVQRRTANKVPEENRISGRNVLKSTDGVSMGKVADYLLSDSYALVDAFVRVSHTRERSTFVPRSAVLRRRRAYDEYEDDRMDPNERVTVIFRFVRSDFLSQDFPYRDSPFAGKEKSALEALKELANDSIWRVEVWENPYFENRIPIEGQVMMSFNLIGRQPLFDKDGNPYGEWIRDANGEKVEKVLRVPLYLLFYRGAVTLEDFF